MSPSDIFRINTQPAIVELLYKPVGNTPELKNSTEVSTEPLNYTQMEFGKPKAKVGDPGFTNIMYHGQSLANRRSGRLTSI